MIEAQAAAKLVEDVANRIKCKDSDDQQRADEIARGKVLAAGVLVDRLESLLLNPPPKLVITDDDVQFRGKMLSDIRAKLSELARDLYYRSDSLQRPQDSHNHEIDATTTRHHSNQDQNRSLNTVDETDGRESLLNKDERSESSSSSLKTCCWVAAIIIAAIVFILLMMVSIT